MARVICDISTLSAPQLLSLALDPNTLPKVCEEGDLGAIKVLLKNNAEVNNVNKNGIYPIHGAVKSNSEEVVKILLENEVDIDVVDAENITPLMYAAGRGYSNIIKQLINFMIETRNESEKFATTSRDYKLLANNFIKMKDSSGQSAIHYASRNGHKECVELLIEYGGDINLQDKTGKTALHIAASLGFHEIVDILVNEGADIDSSDSFGRTPIHYSCIGGTLESVKLLILNHCDVFVVDNEGLTCLHFSCLNSKPDILEYLIENGSNSSNFDINVADDFGRTPIHAAASVSCLRSCKILVENKCNLTKLDEEGKTAISWAVNRTNQPTQTPPFKFDDTPICQCLQYLWEKWEEGKFEMNPDKEDEYGRNPLHYACYFGLQKSIQFLLQKTINFRSKDQFGREPFHFSCSNLQSLEIMLEKTGKELVSLPDENGCYPIHFSAFCGNKGSLNELLKINPEFKLLKDKNDNTILHFLAINEKLPKSKLKNTFLHIISLSRDILDMKNKNGRTSIHEAVIVGNFNYLQVVSENLSKMELLYYYNMQDTIGRSPIHYAAIRGDAKCFRFLVENHADPNLLDKSKLTPIHLATGRNNVEFINDILHSTDFPGTINGNFPDKNGWSPIFYACYFSFIDIVDSFILKYSDFSELKDNYGNTLVHVAVDADQFNSLEFLIGESLDEEEDDEKFIDKKNRIGVAPIHIAAAKGNEKCLELLLRSGCNVNILDKNKRSALHYAAFYGQLSCLTILLESQQYSSSLIDVNLTDKEGNTPLFYSIVGDYLPCVTELIKYKAQLTIPNSNARTPFHAASWYGSVHICELLLNINDKLLNKPCSFGRTALHRAAARGHISIIKFLVSKGVDVQAKDTNGATPLMLACFYHQLEAIITLLQHKASPTTKDKYERTCIDYAKKGASKITSSKLESILELFGE